MVDAPWFGSRVYTLELFCLELAFLQRKLGENQDHLHPKDGGVSRSWLKEIPTNQ
jgi:hypothetical protein